MKILAVDDDELILELLVDCLSKEGFTDVTTVYSGSEALDLIENLDAADPDDEFGTFDCFLLDIQMPGMTGIELCKKIRALPQYAQTPILMVTTLTDRKYVEQAFAAGAIDYVNKPFDQLELATRIRMANMLVNEQRRGLQAYFMASALDVGLEDKRAALFQSPVAIKGVENVVDFTVLENYLIQLSRKGLHDSVAIGFCDVQARDEFANGTVEQFYDRLRTIAEVLTQCLGDEGYMLSYFGSGIFVSVMDRKNYAINKAFLTNLETLALKHGLATPEGKPAIVAGEAVANSAQNRNDVHTFLLDAITVAIARSRSGSKDSDRLTRLLPRAAKFNFLPD